MVFPIATFVYRCVIDVGLACLLMDTIYLIITLGYHPFPGCLVTTRRTGDIFRANWNPTYDSTFMAATIQLIHEQSIVEWYLAWQV